MSRRYAFPTLLAAASIVAATQADAGRLSPGMENFIAGKPGSAEVRALVILQDQAPVQTMDEDLRATRATRALRNKTVVESLQEAAFRSQTALLQELEARRVSGTVREFETFWIVNGIAVTTTIDYVRELAARRDVEVVEPDLPVELIEPVRSDDPDRDPTQRGGGIGITPGLVAIDADRVWYELGIIGTGAIVGNMDTGVDGSHPALSARWRGNFAPAAHCWHDALNLGHVTPQDLNGHGTHVMGTITGLAPNDSIGVAPGALWIADNSINQGVGGAFDADVIAALQWFSNPDGNVNTIDDVPDVIQNSWRINEGFGGNYVDCDTRWWAAIDNCEAAGVVLTWSAGNEGPGSQTVGSPADRATTPYNAFSVGSTIPTPPYTISSFSSRGPSGCGGAFATKPEISAPGSNIYSSLPGGQYGLLSGTSMAGPHVAGVVGLMRSANPNLDVQTIKQIIMDNATDLGSIGEDNTYGHGFINAYECVLASLTGYGSIEGFVTDAISGDPIQGVGVDVLADPREAVTDVNGFFKILLPAGSWTLEYSFFGYLTQSQGFNVVAQQISDGDFAMTLAPQAIVSGVVRDYTNALVAGATIQVLDTPLSTATSLPDGSYSISVPDGATYDFRARKNGLGTDTHALAVSGAETLNFVLPELSAEDFESGDFLVWPWQFSGQAPWTIDSTEKFEGESSARSGVIGSSQSSTMEITLPVAAPGNVSFYSMVSSESGADFLRFYIDGVLKGSWSGTLPWALASYPVTNGSHTFRWTYQKNSSGTSGSDAAWVDLIQFPSIGFPELELSAASMGATLEPGQTTQQTLTLSNTGEGQLDFIASVHGVASAHTGPASAETPEGDGAAISGDTTDPVLLGSGGPDAFGYSWQDSDDPGGPAYQWVEISGIGNGLAAGDNTYSAALPLGFTFSFYGNNYTAVRISANGFISFTAPSGAYNLNGTIPSVSDPDDMIAAFWDDLNPLQGGAMYVYQDVVNTRYIVQWNNIPLAGSGGTIRETFQIILNQDGSILTQYKSVQSPTSATVGIENATGNDGLQVVFNGAYLHNNLAIRFATSPPVNWLSVNPTVGSIAPLGSADLDVDYDATGLVVGTYEALIRVGTNDPDETVVNVPVTLIVSEDATDVVVGAGLPTVFELAVPQPNPFSKETAIRYAVPVEGHHVSIAVFDVAGRRVRTLVDGAQAAGRHVAGWDGRDEQGSRISSGVYFYRMSAGSFEQVQKVTVLK